jgi:hypothetical protein
MRPQLREYGSRPMRSHLENAACAAPSDALSSSLVVPQANWLQVDLQPIYGCAEILSDGP